MGRRSERQSLHNEHTTEREHLCSHISALEMSFATFDSHHCNESMPVKAMHLVTTKFQDACGRAPFR